MNTLTKVFSASILFLGCFAGPSFAEDNVEVDVDGLCQAGFNICYDTCNLNFGGNGFSSQLSFDLCIDNCSSNLRACTASDDGAIVRQSSRARDAIGKFTDQSFSKLPD